MNKKSLLLVGNGKMGSGFISTFRHLFDITIVSPNSKPNFECEYFPSLSQITTHKDIIIFAVKPYQIEKVIKELNSNAYSTNTKVISLIAGAKTKFFMENLKHNPQVYLCMPNLPVKSGNGIVAVFGPEKLEFLNSLGVVVYCKKEEEIDKFTSVIGSGSGFVFHILSAYQEAAKELDLGSEVNSQELILSLFEGTLQMAKQRMKKGRYSTFKLIKDKKLSFGDLEKEVVTPNGTTHAGLLELSKSDPYIKNCLSNAYSRAQELGKDLNEKLAKNKD